jgi:site-specific DNA-methyltransferase (adenine-specific)
VLDFFAGSGTTGEAAAKNGREFILIDSNLEAINVMERRLAKFVCSDEVIEDDNQLVEKPTLVLCEA